MRAVWRLGFGVWGYQGHAVEEGFCLLGVSIA